MRVAQDLLSPSSGAAGAPVPPTDAGQAIRAHAMRRQLASALDPRHIWRADAIARPAAESTLSTGYAALDAALPGGGWPQGQLIELLLDSPGLGELSLLTPLLAQCSTRPMVWVLPCDQERSAERALPYAPALQAAGIDLGRSIFVQPATPREGCWALEQSLRTAHLGAVIGWLGAGSSAAAEFRALRRLHLLATQSRAVVFVLRSTRSAASPSPAALRLQLSTHEGDLQVRVLKRRGRPLLRPLRLQVHPEHWRQARVVPPTAVQPVEVPAHGALASGQRARRWSMKALFAH